MPVPAAAPGLDFPALYAALARHALAIAPHLQTLRIVATGPDGEMVIPVPLPTAAEDLRSRILAVLSALPKGERVGGKKLAEDCETEQRNGHFCRTIAALKGEGLIDVHHLYGYKLA